MEYVLSILGAITLIGTVSTSVVACGGGEKPSPNPSPEEKIDISTKITSPIALGQLDSNKKQDFLNKLQEKLKTMSGLNNITPSYYDVYKAGTTTEIQDSDISAGTSLNIKIVAKGNKFEGNKDNITVNYIQKDNTRTDLSTITQLTGLNITANTTKTYNDLWTEILLNANEFKDLKYNSYETFMYKTNDPTDTIDIKKLNQKQGDIYIILKVQKSKGSNCFGDTPRLKVTLK